MKNHLRKFVFVVACLGLMLSGCEKDLYENQMKEQTSISNGKINTVSINDVTFLIPQLVQYNSHYNYLSNSNSQNAYRGIEDLDLELERILEYAETNGLKSYSIAIKNQSESTDDMYFENLHITHTDGEYKPFIARYNATDDSKKFDVATFSGRIKLFSVDKLTVGSLYFENGQKLPDPAPYNPLEGDIGIGGGGDPPSWMPDWLADIFYHWNGNYLGSNSSSSSSSTSSSSNSGTGVYILGTGYTNVGSTTNTPTVNTSGSSGSGTNSTGVTPNEPEWTYPLTSQIAMANKIRTRLIYSNSEIEPWLENPSNLSLVNQIYFYMAEGGNYPETNSVASTALVQMIANPGVFTSMTPFIIERSIDDSQLDPCTKGILNKLKQSNSIAKVIARFDTPSTPFTINFSQVPNLLHDQQSVYGKTSSVTNFDYNIQLNSNFFNNTGATHVGKAGTMLHEIIHALVMSIAQNESNATLNGSAEFPELWSYYLSNIQNNGNTVTNTMQHLWLVKYQTVIQQALIEYATATNVTPPTGQTLQQFCYYLSWAGIYTGQQPPLGIIIPDSILTSSDKPKVLFQKEAEMNKANTNGQIPSNNPSCN